MTRTAALLCCALCVSGAAHADVFDDVTHHVATNGDVKLHYVSLGQKDDRPLVIMLHGFPDFWYTWRNQMPALAKDHYVVAMDLRGYNKSDKPKGVSKYAMPVLMSDVVAVIRHAGYEKAVVVGNDWGGAIAWSLASYQPDRVDRLIICNLPHLNGLSRELRNNKEQQVNSAYARAFQQEGAHKQLSAGYLAAMVAGGRSEAVRKRYLEAFQRSDIEAMLNYYKANYPNPDAPSTNSAPPMPNVKCPTLVIHGLKDTALLAAGLNDNWEWVDNELTILTLPQANHFVQQDAPKRVTKAMRVWLAD